MAEADLLEEIEDLKETIIELRQELDDVKESRDKELSVLESKVDKVRNEVEDEWRLRLENLERENQENNGAMIAELDTMRNAFNGDVGGWEMKLTKAGSKYYENSETGEIRDSEPEVLFIANAMRKVDEAEAQFEEMKTLKIKFKDLEFKKREGDLAVNKAKVELNSLRHMDKQWKECSKVVFTSMNDVKTQFDAQVDQILLSIGEVDRTGRRIHSHVPKISKIDRYIFDLKAKIKEQEQMIIKLNNTVRQLTSELAEKTEMVKKLSVGFELEVQRLCQPMREKLADAMVQVMKEKAARAQDRREMADFWPSGHMMPTILMKYRALSDEEREVRIKAAMEKDASRALSIEIRANVAESRMWEMKYDDYGREFYEHKQTGETNWEKPEIMNYVPPPGRDELGNVVVTDETAMENWTIEADHRGQVRYRHKETGKITMVPPLAYQRIPRGKPREVSVGEAAQLVLAYIQEKITRHIEKTKQLKHSLENPLTVQQKRKLEKEKKRERAFLGLDGVEEEKEVDPDEGDDLTKYLYDIETVERLAAAVEPKSKGAAKGPDVMRQEKRAFLEESAVRSFDAGAFIGPTMFETDMENITVPEIRGIIEILATSEEKLEQRLTKTRENLKDFSFVLMDKLPAWDEEQREQKRIAEEQEAERRREEIAQEQKRAKQLARRKRRLREKREAALARRLEREMKGIEEEEREELGEGESLSGILSMSASASVVSKSKVRFGDDSSVGLDDGASIGASTIRSGVAHSADGGKEVVGGEGEVGEGGGEGDGGDEEEKQFQEGDDNADKIDEKEKALFPEDDEDALYDDDNEDDVDDNDSVDSELTAPTVAGEERHVLGFVLGDQEDVNTATAKQLTKARASEDIEAVSADLAELAMFCGFTNMRLDELPEDATANLSLYRAEGVHRVGGAVVPISVGDGDECRDDQWLTTSFFVALTSERVDALRQLRDRPYDPVKGLTDKGPLHSQSFLSEEKKEAESKVSDDVESHSTSRLSHI